MLGVIISNSLMRLTSETERSRLGNDLFFLHRLLARRGIFHRQPA
jgi:hypothetical protein